MAISVRLCSGRTSFEVTTGMRIDLVKASEKLETKVATKHILLLNYGGVDVSMYPSGRMLIKAKNEEESLKVASDLLDELGLLEREPPKT